MIVALIAARGIETSIPAPLGLGTFILSNVPWIIWGLGSPSYAWVVLQIGLCFMNVRSARDNPQ